MKHDFRDWAWVKAVAVALFTAAGTAAFLGFFYCAVHWGGFFGEDYYANSQAYYDARQNKYTVVLELLGYQWCAENREGGLTYLEKQRLLECEAELDPERTNFRYIVRDNGTGQILLSSTGEASLASATHVERRSIEWGFADHVGYDSERGLFSYYNSDTTLLLESPVEVEKALERRSLVVEAGVEALLPAQDDFAQAAALYGAADISWLYVTAALTAAALILLVFLMCCAGHRRSSDTAVLNWQDKIPYDIYLCLMIPGAWGLFALAASGFLYADGWTGRREDVIPVLLISALCAAGAMALTAAFFMSTAARIKAGTPLRNTLVWRLCAWLRRTVRRAWRALRAFVRATAGSWPLTGRVIAFFALYLALTLLTGVTVVLAPFFQGAVLYLLCRWTQEWKRIRAGTRDIVSGDPDRRIELTGMRRFPDLLEHAGQLNDLGAAINTAVEERMKAVEEQMKSERMKAELITNVSHDLKTPLTSIINYVDLLKKEDLPGEKAREYVQVLDRKSQRLKKLTEDLVEASKASTGALAVNAERIGMGQLTTQALGEYGEKLSGAGLHLVAALPEEEIFVLADGRHLWRILDNLMGNCVKYAMPGTRVYLDLCVREGRAVFTLKNISARQLNIPAEQLMERFVQGDESRAAEGSGLGLSIARSLTELQGGTFRLEVDGDLFKAVMELPEVR